MGFRRVLALAGTAIVGLGVSAAPAGAAGAEDDYVPYTPSGFFVYDWSGLYAGGNLGGAHTNATAPVTLLPDVPDVGIDNELLFERRNNQQSETSLTGGLQAGWQWHWGKMVLGGEVGFSLLRFDTNKPLRLIDVNRSVEARDILLLTGRLGYADGRWLAYAKGGVASARIEASYDDLLTGETTSTSGREIGWTAGIGIDYALTYNLILGLEYNYVHFRADLEGLTLPNFPNAEFSDVDIDTQTLVMRLNYRFSTPCCIGPGGY